MPDSPAFIDGSEFFEVSETPNGRVLVMGRVVLSGETVVLENFLIEPMDTVKLRLGTSAVLGVRRKLLQTAHQEGYTYLEIAGMRMSGANPHRPLRVRSRT